ncbi:hypothetical protein BN2475_190021 [Paraburkholderia ribeironis]|uniref:Uncharacterized protein n=1 Tax=Paraburkholderia ribeironis TaxID=1247936 RepID=A0A1N7RV93_9BURK|nr:hypothetical protein BN2475_190021 [Paraburkholderia ribeironis]
MPEVEDCIVSQATCPLCIQRAARWPAGGARRAPRRASVRQQLSSSYPTAAIQRLLCTVSRRPARALAGYTSRRAPIRMKADETGLPPPTALHLAPRSDSHESRRNRPAAATRILAKCASTAST